MKKITYVISMVFACLILLCACDSNKAQEVANIDCELWETVPEGANPKFVEDYMYLWDLLETEYPYLSTAERITGKKAEEIKAKYYKWIPVAKDDPQMFYKYVIDPCLDEFDGTGHLCAIDNSYYDYMYTVYSSNPETLDYPTISYLYNVLNSPSAKEFYASTFEMMDTAESEGNSEILYNQCDNLTIKYYPEKSAGYLKINGMNSYSDINNPEYKMMLNFFEKLEKEGYANCIIDIRGNGGGNDLFWRDGIVNPNLTKSVNYNLYSLVKGEICKDYINHHGEISEEPCMNISDFPLESFPKLSENELSNYKYYWKNNINVLPSDTKEPAFTGKFWLLVDEGCYSSSESFTIFCKNTGFATIVGENTGGDGGGIDPIIFSLPNSGICLRFTSGLALNADGSGNEELGTTPDYPITSGEDALEKCFELINGE